MCSTKICACRSRSSTVFLLTFKSIRLYNTVMRLQKNSELACFILGRFLLATKFFIHQNKIHLLYIDFMHNYTEAKITSINKWTYHIYIFCQSRLNELRQPLSERLVRNIRHD